jgi:hypothetical protein
LRHDELAIGSQRDAVEESRFDEHCGAPCAERKSNREQPTLEPSKSVVAIHCCEMRPEAK